MAYIPPSLSADAQQAFRDVWRVLGAFDGSTMIPLSGRRIAAGDAVEPGELVTLRQVRALAKSATTTPTTIPGALNGGLVRIGTYATRGLAGTYPHTVFLASDRNYVAWASDGTNWQYAFGVQRGTLSPDQKPSLTTSDAGYLFYATDFARAYRYSGSAWADAQASDRGSIVFFDADPGTGWHLADGTASITKSTSTGGTTSVTMPDLTTAKRFLRSVASSPGGTGGSATTHTHSVNPPNTTTGSPSNPDTGLNSANQVVQSGAGVTVAAADHSHHMAHTHDVDIAAFASAAPSGTSGDDALPPYINELPFYRL